MHTHVIEKRGGHSPKKRGGGKGCCGKDHVNDEYRKITRKIKQCSSDSALSRREMRRIASKEGRRMGVRGGSK